jgi:hypothetical protein
LRKAVLLLAIAFNVLPVFGQLSAGLKGIKRIEIKRCYVLPDRDYSPERIRTDATLVFVREDSLRPSQANRYWLKLEATNPSRYAQPCRLTVPYPNPSTSSFTLKVSSNDGKEAITMTVTDINGRVMERRNNLTAGQTVQLGSGYDQGIYIVVIWQGTNRRQVKLFKAL